MRLLVRLPLQLPGRRPRGLRAARRRVVRAAAAAALFVALLLALAVPADAPLRAQQTDALPPLLHALATQAERLHAAGVSVDGNGLGAKSKTLRDAIALRSLRLNDAGAVQVAVRLWGDGPPAGALAALGVETQIWRPDLGHAQLLVPPARLRALLALPGIRDVALPSYAISARGAVTTEGDTALRFEALRARTGLTGDGVRVGVIADGVAGLAGAQASGDLPTLAGQQDFTGEGVDGGAEGTALLEIVHDIAPNAALYFAAATTDAEMIEAVDYLAQRTDVVVDDLSFHFPDDQRSAVSLNTAAALNHPAWPIRAYVTAAGNWALRHYEGEFRAGPGGRTLGLTGAGPVHLFGRDGATDQLGRGEAPYNEIRLESGDELRAVLHWNDPWGDSINDYDLFLLDESGAVVASGAAQQGVSTRNPRERIVYQHDGESGRFRLVVQNADGRAAPRRLEMFAFGPKALEPDGTILNFNTTASSLLAQSDAPGGVITIAAVGHAPADFHRARPYSSRGPTNNGARKPDLAAVDNVAITGGGNFASPFFGTSAAAPHVAALAALLLEARPQLLAEDGGRPDREREILRHVLTGSAIDLAPPGPDDATGAGRVDALAAATLLDATVLVVERVAPAGPGSLRAAIDAANRPAGGPRAIFIDAGLSIPLTATLPPITRGDVSLSGAATIVGDRLPAGAPGLVLSAAAVAIDGLTISGVPGVAIRVAGAEDVAIDGVTLTGNGAGIQIDDGSARVAIGAMQGVTITGVPGVAIRVAGAEDVAIDGVTLTGNGAGIQIDDGSARVAIGAMQGVTITANDGPGIVVAGEGTHDVTIQNSRIGVTPAGLAAGNAGDGVRVEAGATGVVLGAPAAAEPRLRTAQVTAQVTSQATTLVHTIRGRVILNGQPALAGTIVEALIDGQLVAATTVGVVDVDGAPGFVLTIPGPGLVVRFRVAGLPAMRLIFFEPGARSDIVLEASGEFPQSELALPGANVIAYNAGAGLRHDAGIVSYRGNAIYGNADGDVRGDAPTPAPPVLTAFHYTGDRLRVDATAPAGATVDLYVVEDPAAPGVVADPDGAGGALRYLGSALPGDASFSDGGFRAAGLAPGTALALTALATDASGATSRFATNLRLGPGPRIDAVFPAEGSNAGGVQVTITGAGLGDLAGFHVAFGDRAATALSVSDTRAVVITPPHAAGPAALTIEVSDGRTRRVEEAFSFLAGRVVLLSPGWNNVTWSGPRTPITGVIAPLAPRVNRVWAWFAAEQRWRSYRVGAPAIVNRLTALQPGQAIWLLLEGDRPLIWEQPPP